MERDYYAEIRNIVEDWLEREEPDNIKNEIAYLLDDAIESYKEYGV